MAISVPRCVSLRTTHWQAQSDYLFALAACDKTFYPYIHILLQISAGLPVYVRTNILIKQWKFSKLINVLGWQTKACKDCRRRTFTITFRLTLSKSSAILRWKNGRLQLHVLTDGWSSLNTSEQRRCSYQCVSDFDSDLSFSYCSWTFFSKK